MQLIVKGILIVLIISVGVWVAMFLGTWVHELGHAIIGQLLFGKWGEIEVNLQNGFYLPYGFYLPSVSTNEIANSIYAELAFVGGWSDTVFLLTTRHFMRKIKNLITLVYPIRTFLLFLAVTELFYGASESLNMIYGVIDSTIFNVVASGISAVISLTCVVVFNFRYRNELEKWLTSIENLKK